MRRKVFFYFSLALIIVFIVVFYFEYKAVNSVKSTAWTQAQDAECGIVLTGGPGRIREGMDLLANRSIKKLIIAGVNPNSEIKEIFPLWIYYPEVDEKDVVLEKRSETTFGNATQSLPLVEILNCQDVLLITSSLHMYRSKRTFYRVFPKIIDIKTHLLGRGSESESVFDRLQETLKSLFYSLWAY
ncbi:MAG: YdcF family protein [Bdellovibrionaceae bacterium]|nr:YdcF family protein [Pseudobdellovibrionaceae bacterium]